MSLGYAPLVWGEAEQMLCRLYYFSFSSLFSIFYIFFFSCLIDIKQDCDHLKSAPFPLLGVTRLPACSQARPHPHPGSIQVLNFMYSLQHISQALIICRHVCTHIHTCL